MDEYAIYLRKSRADLEAEALGEGETLARHKSILFKLAEKHEIRTDQITVYQEIVSGESISARPEMQRLLNDVYQKKYKAVLVMEVERLARGNTKDQGEVSDAFQYSNTKIITPVKVYDPANEFDQEYFEFGLFMSRREYKTIKRRMEAGRLASVAEGNYVGSIRPYGYDIKRINKKERILVENPDESRYVRMMFDWFTVDRMTSGQIAKRLTDLHVPTMTGNPEWNRATVKDILQNVHYTGQVRWNRRKHSKEFDSDSGHMVKTKRRMTPEDYLTYKGKHQPIISQEQFDLAQTLFNGQIPVKACETVVNPYAGIMKCACCGKNIRFSAFYTRGNTQPRFYHPESAICKKKSIPATEVNSAIIQALQNSIDDFTIRLQNDSYSLEMARFQQVMDALESELDKQEKRRKKLFEAFEDGLYDNDEFIERKQVLNGSIEAIKKQIQEAKESAPEPVDYEDKIIKIHKVLEYLKDDTIDAKTKNIFFRSVIAVIEYDVEDYGINKGGKALLHINLL